jgi:hypothetical protein
VLRTSIDTGASACATTSQVGQFFRAFILPPCRHALVQDSQPIIQCAEAVPLKSPMEAA